MEVGRKMSTFIARRNIKSCVEEMIKYINSLDKTELSELDLREQTKLYMIAQNYLLFPTKEHAYHYCGTMKEALEEVINHEIGNGVVFKLEDILKDIFFSPYVRENYLITHKVIKHGQA
jgi:hypothetical protein